MTETEICNWALSKIGAKRITSMSDGSVNARACSDLFSHVRRSELEAHTWNFAIRRGELPADATAPSSEFEYQYSLPAGFLRLIGPMIEDTVYPRDWQLEGQKILTDDEAPLKIRYIFDVTTVSEWAATFCEAVAAKLAYELCEPLTQSNTKKDAAGGDYEAAIRKAKRTNAIQRGPTGSLESDWITCR